MFDVLHINDNNLVIESAGKVSYSQGYAWLKSDEVNFDLGDAASPVSHCRLSPQEINNRYWQQCEQSAIPANGAGMRHAADLVWQHLSQLKQHKNLSELIFVVPSHYRESNLQLLLGIAKACQLEVKGLVNKAVVAMQNQAKANGEYWHFDVQLHQTVCSRIKLSDGLVKLDEVEILSDVGIHLMQEALLKGLQNNFIQNDRFDPLHDAATEQQLFDQLATIAMQLADSGKASVGLEHQGRLYNTTLDNKEWQNVLMPFSNRLSTLSGSADGSYVDLNAAFGTAGLDSLSEAGLVHLSGASVGLASQLAQASDTSNIIYKTDLPVKNLAEISTKKTVSPKIVDASSEVESDEVLSSNVKPELNSKSDASVATHVLHAGIAVPLSQAILSTDSGVLRITQGSVGNIQALLDAGKLFVVNDDGRTKLKVNDRLGSHLADGVVTTIHVL